MRRDDKVGGLVAAWLRLLRFAMLPHHDKNPDVDLAMTMEREFVKPRKVEAGVGFEPTK